MKAFPSKPAILAAALMGLAASAPAQQEEPYAEALRELNIMSNIFAATLQEDGRGNNGPFASSAPRALYLAGQGMVFTFDINNPWFRGNFGAYWQEFGTNMAQLAQEVAAEVSASFPDVDFDFDFDELGPVPPVPAPPGQPFIYRGDQFEQLREAMEEQREAAQDMAEEMRDKQRDIQDLQRDLRDLQRELRDAQDAAGVEGRIAEVEAELQSERAALERQRAAYEQYMTEYQARREEQLTAYSRTLVDQAVSTLCDYGATLRALPADEHLTLIFENFSQDRAQVHVFEAAAVSACGSAEELLAGAVSYQM